MIFSRTSLAAMLGVCLGLVACGGSGGTGPTQVVAAPQIACPVAPDPAESLDGSAQPVSFASPTVTGGQAPLTTSCSPASGSKFPVGTSTVTCSTSDARAQAASCTFPVVVLAPPKLPATSFLAFGDSITWGEDGRDSGSAALGQPRIFVQLVGQTYPDVLQSELRARYTQQQVTVTNAGCPGESLSDPGIFSDKANCPGARADDPSAFRRFTSLAATHQWDALLLMEGSNDVNIASGDSRVLPIATGYLQQIVSAATANGMRVIVATIPPMVPPGADNRAKGYQVVPTYNNMVRSLATSAAVPLADIYGAFGSDAPTLIGFDGLHPDAAGYQRIADTFFAAIKSSLETRTAASQRRR